MPPKVRELESDLVNAGFTRRSGKGSHRNYSHPSGAFATVSGKPGADAKPYQIREVAKAIKKASQ